MLGLKRVVLAVLLSMAACSTALAKESEEVFSSGKDWSQGMTNSEKLMSLIPPSLLFYRYHVPLKRELPEYIPMIDQVLSANPELAGEEVTNIFASTVYVYEPESREALRMMELEFLRGGYDATPLTPPRLEIRPDGREVLKVD